MILPHLVDLQALKYLKSRKSLEILPHLVDLLVLKYLKFPKNLLHLIFQSFLKFHLLLKFR